MAGPKAPKGAKNWWPDISYRYLAAFKLARVPTRAIAIGGPLPIVGAADPEWGHWSAVGDLFQGEIDSDSFVNVVCAPLGMESQSFGRSHFWDPDLAAKAGIGAVELGDREEEVVSRQYVIATYHTEGRRNVAITGGNVSPSAAEAEALRTYDEVLTPSARWAARLERHGVIASVMTPIDLSKQASDLYRPVFSREM